MPDDKSQPTQQPPTSPLPSAPRKVAYTVAAKSKDGKFCLLSGNKEYRVGEAVKYPRNGEVAQEQWDALRRPVPIDIAHLLPRPADVTEELYKMGYFVETESHLVNQTEIKMALAKVLPSVRTVVRLFTKK